MQAKPLLIRIHDRTSWAMNKPKTHSGAAKRFKVNGKGRVKFKATGMNHNLGQKTTKQKRHLNVDRMMPQEEQPRVDRMLHLKPSKRKPRSARPGDKS